MAALTATTPTRAGTTSAGAAVAASDTIASSILGSRGAYLEITNAGAGTDNITISDNSVTASGAPAASNAPTLANGGTCKVFLIRPEQVDGTGVVTITHSQPTGVTYRLFPRD